jgi:hypothetical protein
MLSSTRRLRKHRALTEGTHRRRNRLDLAVGHAALAAADSTELASRSKPCSCSLHYQLALHLREAGHDVEEKPASWGLRVNTICQAPKMYVARLEAVNQIYEAFDTATQPIQLPHDQRVAGA